ncbi:MAG TPA: ComEC/Rec2 family competence protein [Fimbriimonadaceae bacterium]|nr:ComEC/Rec2 family competence protein [Fimbriimonadaceae bacterium]
MATILRNRPLLIIAVGLMVGLTLFEYPWNALFLLPAIWLLNRSAIKLLCLAASLGLGIYLRPPIFTEGVSKTQYVETQARIVSVPRIYPGQISYEIEDRGVKYSVTEPDSADRSIGDFVAIRGLAQPLREGTESYKLSHGVVGQFRPIEVKVLSTGPQWLRSAAELRKRFVGFSAKYLPADEARILDALCFNVEGGLDEDLTNALRATGTIHIISASGLHVLVIAAALEFLLNLWPIPRPIKIGLVLIALAFYAGAAGLQPPILRSVVLAATCLTAYLWRREADLLSALSLAAILYLIYDPRGIYDVGFQFSFVTVTAFCLFGSYHKADYSTSPRRILSEVKVTIQTSCLAYFATIPLTAFYFGTISIVAVPANLAVFLSASVLVIMGMVAFAASPFFPALSEWLSAWLLSPLVQFVEKTALMFGNLSISSIPTLSFNGYWLVLIYGALLLRAKEPIREA